MIPQCHLPVLIIIGVFHLVAAILPEAPATVLIEIEEIGSSRVPTRPDFRAELASAIRQNRSASDVKGILHEWSLRSSTLSAIGDGLGLPHDTSERDLLLDLNAEDSTTGRSPIQEAAANGQKDTVQLLLQYPGVDVDGHTAEGETAAFLVIPHGCDILPLLLDAGANPVGGWRWRKSPLERAVELGSMACLQHLSRSSMISLDTYPKHNGAEELAEMAWEPEVGSSTTHDGRVEFKVRVMQDASKVNTGDGGNRLAILHRLHLLNFDSFAVDYTWGVLFMVTSLGCLGLCCYSLYHLAVWGPLDHRRPFDLWSLLGLGDPLKFSLGSSSAALLPESAPPTARHKARVLSEEPQIEPGGKVDFNVLWRAVIMRNSSWLSMFVKVPGIYVPVEDVDDFFTPQETLQDRLTSIERRRTLVRLIHYGEVVLRCSALIGSVLWMWFITDRPILAVSLVAAAIIRILVTVCLASQSKETHLITIFGRGIEKSTEGHVRLLMKSFDEEEGSPHPSMAAVKEEARNWLMKFYSRGYNYPRHSSVLVPLVVALVSSVAAVTFTVHGQWLTLGIFPAVYMTTESPVALFGRAGTFMRYAAVWMEALFIMAGTELLFNICACLVVGIAAIQARLDGQRSAYTPSEVVFGEQVHRKWSLLAK
ncbi:hypothetical protein FOL46_006142 [Perkinsus olseni]|uniref:Uncharacterized protein n=1 Tax=Perkinsus olseni TaxID=32597 RepID=A0A7J6MQS6_PEROL|nr:hypothetical protein FOL46_006142 [Perkinsus olseni]